MSYELLDWVFGIIYLGLFIWIMINLYRIQKRLDKIKKILDKTIKRFVVRRLTK